jgi:hypothetical protein
MDTSETANINKNVTGRNCFELYYDRLFKNYHLTKNKEQYRDKTPEFIVNNAFDAFHQEQQSEIDHYFRNLYSIINFVSLSFVENKRHYTNIVRAQLSRYEIALLFYNGLWGFGRKKLKEYIEVYELLENMNIKDIISPNDEVQLYEKKAYGNLDVQKYFVNQLN